MLECECILKGPREQEDCTVRKRFHAAGTRSWAICDVDGNGLSGHSYPGIAQDRCGMSVRKTQDAEWVLRPECNYG